jgi:hypothetical protein
VQWERYLACSSLPDPRKEAEVNEYIAEVGEYSDEGTDLESELQKCREIEKVSAVGHRDPSVENVSDVSNCFRF